ncbi:hypothetical protein [Pseudoponticoccus marisrubri]|uniref:Uncharacterized protein n=1 Tax=Pseudoponticoccus marisrubri TaxID=1685382 RepID=A0A0W7WPX8_9RHOB|nr:hypothetical protein [Pseudoponticoccus marisrubri]KUF12633.1 hypothetical protein AVJ23_02635 [Pseudoponticoccus marisrubri]
MRDSVKLIAVGIFVVVMPVLLLVTDFLVFSVTAGLYSEPAGPRAYLAHRTGITLAPARPVLAARDYKAAPLTLEEKRDRADHLAAALPPAPEGWTLAPYAEGDLWALRPDLDGCREMDRAMRARALLGDGPCPMPDARHAWSYRKGDRRIIVLIRYHRGKDAWPAGRIHSPGPLAGAVAHHFGGGYESHDYRPFMARGQWRFGMLPLVVRRMERAEMRPYRIFAHREGDGELHVFVLSNAQPGRIKAVLKGMDYALLEAMVAPVPDLRAAGQGGAQGVLTARARP